MCFGREMKVRVRLVLMSLAAVVSLAIYLEIESLNVQAGGILPRVLSESGNPKWRVLGSPVRQLTRRYEFDYRVTNGLADNEPLPREAADQIREQVAVEAPRYEAEARLRSFVGSWGLLQYPLSLLLIIAGAVQAGAVKNWINRIVCITVASIGCLCLGMALYRAYLASLGW